VTPPDGTGAEEGPPHPGPLPEIPDPGNQEQLKAYEAWKEKKKAYDEWLKMKRESTRN
jgi:hypothetical protein